MYWFAVCKTEDALPAGNKPESGLVAWGQLFRRPNPSYSRRLQRGAFFVGIDGGRFVGSRGTVLHRRPTNHHPDQDQEPDGSVSPPNDPDADQTLEPGRSVLLLQAPWRNNAHQNTDLTLPRCTPASDQCGCQQAATRRRVRSALRLTVTEHRRRRRGRITPPRGGRLSPAFAQNESRARRARCRVGRPCAMADTGASLDTERGRNGSIELLIDVRPAGLR